MRLRLFIVIIIAIVAASLTALACSQTASAPATRGPQSPTAVTAAQGLKESLPGFMTRGG